MVLLAALLASGCGGKKGDVSGTVTYQGKPLPSGTITFLDARNEAVGSSPITDGKYTIYQVPVGPVKVLVTTPPPLPPNLRPPPPNPAREAMREAMIKKKTGGKSSAPPPAPSDDRPPPPVRIPDKYGLADQSDLTYTVQPGKQEHAIDLK
jgi:hypothetical protein